MRTVLGVDLAARYSAVCLMDEFGRVLQQYDSWGTSETGFVEQLAGHWAWAYNVEDAPAVMVVEDLPHRLPFSSLVKRVARIQGRIVERMSMLGVADRVLFVPPALWRKHYSGLERGTGAPAVVAVAARLGYFAPELGERITKAGDKAIARKVSTDYCAAYLIARWAVNHRQGTGSYDAHGTSRYSS